MPQVNPAQGAEEKLRQGLHFADNGTDRLRIIAGEITLAEYVYRPRGIQQNSPRPYFHPLRTLAGNCVTDFRPDDHPWHQGLSFALPVVGNENFWGGPSYQQGQGYVQLANNGSQRHHRFTEFRPAASDSVEAGFVEEIDWVSHAGGVLLSETRRITAKVLDDTSWRLRFAVELRNVTTGAILLGSPTTMGRPDAGYGGLFWRAPMSFIGGDVRTQAGSGGEELRGERAPWMSYTGTHSEGQRSTVVIVDSEPDAPLGPPWFVRTSEYPCLGPAPFFHEECELVPGGIFAAHYDVTVTG